MMKYPIRALYSPLYTIDVSEEKDPMIRHLATRYYRVMMAIQHKKANFSFIEPDFVDPAIITSLITPEYALFLQDPLNIVKCLHTRSVNPMFATAIKNAMQSMVMGTIKATQLSYAQGGFTINIGGGFHHARKNRCGGFCIYNDYVAAAQWLWRTNPLIRIMYIDLDAHFGDGVLEELGNDKRFYYYDIFNTFTFDMMERKSGRNRIYGIPQSSEDSVYLSVLLETLEVTIDTFCPDFVFYNAGSDPLYEDQLGHLNLSAIGLKKRDRYVYETLRKRNLPAIMTLSGGYTEHSIEIVADSIVNIINRGEI